MLEQNKIPAVTNTRKRTVAIVITLVAVLGIASSLLLGREQEPWQPDYSQISLGTVSRQAVAGNITVTGILNADSKAVVTSPLQGIVEKVMVKEGDKVKKGDVLFTLDQKDLQVKLSQARLGVESSRNRLEQAKLGLDTSQLDYSRSEQLYNAGGISQQVFEQITAKRDLAQAQYDAAKIGLENANQTLKSMQLTMDKATVTSPLDGVVASCNITAHDIVGLGVHFISVVASDSLSLSGTLNEAELNNLQPGQVAKVHLDSIPGKTFSGTVSFISPVSIPTGQLFPVKIILKNKEGILKPGMTASADIRTENKNALAVPNTALFRRDGRPNVYVVSNGKAVKTEVQTGYKGSEATVILAGLKEGDMIVAKGTDAVMDGMSLPPEEPRKG